MSKDDYESVARISPAITHGHPVVGYENNVGM